MVICCIRACGHMYCALWNLFLCLSACACASIYLTSVHQTFPYHDFFFCRNFVHMQFQWFLFFDPKCSQVKVKNDHRS